MKRFSRIVAILFVTSGLSSARGQAPQGKYDVLTQHNDIYRSGIYAGETLLRPSNVSSRSFGKIFARRVLGQIWGQPLYVRGVPVKGRLRNMVYVATSENRVYGFDADDRSPDERTTPLLSVSLGDPKPIGQLDFYTILPSNGTTSTPVIDLGTPPDPGKGTLYVVAKLKQDNKFHIFALDLRSLAIRPNAAGQPTDVIVEGTARGQRDGSTTTVSFGDSDHLNRPALLISKNHLIVAFGSGPNGDWDAPKTNYHGWVMSYSLPSLVQTGVFISTPSTDTGMGGIWQAGSGLAADDEGNIYFTTGNGRFQSTHDLPDLANAFVKLANRDGALRLVDWYSPPSRDILEACDLDLGSSGPSVIQEAGKVLGAGKSGILYVLDKENMGKTDKGSDQAALLRNWRGVPDCTTGQCFRIAENQYESQSKQVCDMSGFPFEKPGFNGDNQWQHVNNSYPHVHGSPVVWKLGAKNFNLYVWPEQDFLKAYHFDGQKFARDPIGSSAPLAGAMMSMPGGILSLSWDGTNTHTGILWASRPDPDPWQYGVGSPFISVFHDQQHFVFRNRDGEIWDSFYIRGANRWRFIQIPTKDNPAASDIFVSVFHDADQQHFVYTDSARNIWDSFYRRGDDKWLFQSIETHGHTPAGAIFVSDFDDQQHFVWKDGSGRLWDSFYAQADDQWHFQEINTNGHLAAGNVFVSVFHDADQQHFVYTDSARNIWDSFYRRGDDKWLFQPIETHGHTPAGAIFVSDFHDQQHFVWNDGSGRLWDSFYAQADDNWHFQEINTEGHPAAGNLFVSVFGAADQQHFVYTDSAGDVWDSFYIRGDDLWSYAQVNTNGHRPVGGIFVSDFFDQQHFVFPDGGGIVWDSFYAQQGNSWHFNKIQNTFDCSMGASMNELDLTRNEAPCNAINKIVRGYLEAFDATPRVNGQLSELWNSKEDRRNGVWFAKGSQPTIADGKVFLAEFPAPIPGKDWSASDAFGRLVVYSTRPAQVPSNQHPSPNY